MSKENRPPRFFDAKIIAAGVVTAGLSVLLTSIAPAEILDAKFYFDEAQAKTFFSGLSEADVGRYFTHEIVDLLFIGSYTTLLFLALRKRMPGWVGLAFFPAVFDLLETGTILYGLKNGPVFLRQLGYFTAAKWIFFTLAKVTVIYGLVRARFFKNSYPH